jgi:predicted nucleic acid-binding protein
VVVTGSLTGVCRDPKDGFILECATLGHADLIVTGDRDLLCLGSHEAIRIVTRDNTWIAPNSSDLTQADPNPVLN